MRMLSRVAERLYWMARYLERTEDVARLTQAYTHLIMDIPEGSEPGWEILVQILDATPTFGQHHRVYNEQNVLKFLIADSDNPGSIRSSIKSARENVRTTRDVLPGEAWEQVNELYLYAEEHAEKSFGRRNRHAFLDQIISHHGIARPGQRDTIKAIAVIGYRFAQTAANEHTVYEFHDN